MNSRIKALDFSDRVVFKGRENTQLLKKIEALRFDVWCRIIDPESAVTRFSLDQFDYDGWHITYLDNDLVIASGRLMISTDRTSIPDLCSIEPFVKQMTFPVCVLNRLVVHWLYTKKGLGTENIRDRIELATTLGAKQVWIEEQSKGISLLSQMGFQEMGPSLDRSVKGDWRIMCKTILGNVLNDN